ncbi:MAG: radical SAM protein [Pirellulaceae bacterium]|nr:radical SAM protein [Pirellulaceae bacterium]
MSVFARLRNRFGIARNVHGPRPTETIPLSVRRTWKPDKSPPLVLLRWLATTWCNYRCPYCRQSHARWTEDNLNRPHCFDNQPVEAWLSAFRRHFAEKRLSLLVTGGEPLLDHAAMSKFLNGLTDMPTVECIRIDTNAALSVRGFECFDPRKITLMCTFHPSQTTEERFFAKIDALLSLGFNIGMVNYVMHDGAALEFNRRCRALAAKGIPLHPNPLWDSAGAYSPEAIRLFREYLPALDYEYRTNLSSPRGKPCFFPAIGYQMNPRGAIHVGCHPGLIGSFFDADLPPLFPDAVPCPSPSCVCLDMYSFLAGQERNQSPNPLAMYGDALMNLPARAG